MKVVARDIMKDASGTEFHALAGIKDAVKDAKGKDSGGEGHHEGHKGRVTRTSKDKGAVKGTQGKDTW